MVIDREAVKKAQIENLKQLFLKIYKVVPSIKKLSGGGSSRTYYRLQGEGISVVGVIGEEIEENKTFIRLDESLESAGIKVPHVIAISKDHSCYLLQDLGDESLFKLLDGKEKMSLAERALKELVKIQTLPTEYWEKKVGYKPFSERLIRWDLNYFKYDFLKPASILFDEYSLEDDFDKLTNKLTDKRIYEGLMYRDFQSRNVMVKGCELWFIDFQGARRGPLLYDAVSFIWQAKAPFTFKEREELGEFYRDELTKLGFDPKEIEYQLNLMQLFRTLQVLGAYGFRGLIERKSHFIESIPYAIKNLNYLREKGTLKEYPELTIISERLQESEINKVLDKGKEKVLRIQVFSFSYKKGYPVDLSGNGGGFMFDCRAIHNPGRYEEYKRKNGRDIEVIDFLNKTAEAVPFVDNAINIVSPSIERYLKRGFTSLQVGFGCTGGQHRSVYCAEKFASEIKDKYPATNIEVIHIEKENWVV